MGWGKKAQALTSAVAAARVAVAPRPDPRVAAELTRTLSARATASCWVATVIIPFTILAYDGAYYPGQLTRGAIAAAAADGLIVLLLITLRRHVFDRHPWLPFALLAGLICNVTEAVNLLLTRGTASDFAFPHHLILFRHALRTPLTLILARASSLPRESHGHLETGQRTIVETIHRNATRLLQLINDLLLLAQLEAGDRHIDRGPVDVGASLGRIADEAQ